MRPISDYRRVCVILCINSRLKSIKAGIPRRRHRHRHPRESPTRSTRRISAKDVCEDVGVVECGLKLAAAAQLTTTDISCRSRRREPLAKAQL